MACLYANPSTASFLLLERPKSRFIIFDSVYLSNKKGAQCTPFIVITLYSLFFGVFYLHSWLKNAYTKISNAATQKQVNIFRPSNLANKCNFKEP